MDFDTLLHGTQGLLKGYTIANTKTAFEFFQTIRESQNYLPLLRKISLGKSDEYFMNRKTYGAGETATHDHAFREHFFFVGSDFYSQSI